MKIAVVQIKEFKGDISRNIKNHIKFSVEAALKGSELIIFPELSLTGYEPTLAEKLATTKDDIQFDALQKTSDDHNIIIGAGMPLCTDAGIHIGMILFHPNAERQVYYKHFLFKTETATFTSAENESVLVRGTKVALGICYEVSLDEHANLAYCEGADVYIGSVVKDLESIERGRAHFPKIAKQYGMDVLLSNVVGETGGYDCPGSSGIWNKKGECVKVMDSISEGILIYDTVANRIM